jgi:hypothetical protein
MKKLSDLVGMKIVAVKGFRDKLDKRVRHPQIEPEYILFEDCKTYITLEEQDYYCYHDCDGSARCIRIYENEDTWSNIMDNDVNYPHANTDI